MKKYLKIYLVTVVCYMIISFLLTLVYFGIRVESLSESEKIIKILWGFPFLFLYTEFIKEYIKYHFSIALFGFILNGIFWGFIVTKILNLKNRRK